MTGYFPKIVLSRAVFLYFILLLAVSFSFNSHIMPFQWMIFGLFTVLSFFISVHYLTLKWRYISTLKFTEKLFLFALITKVLYVIFIYYFYIETTGTPFGYSDVDAVNYDRLACFLLYF
jgi:hypothetical protein